MNPKNHEQERQVFGCLAGRRTVVTGSSTGIGRAVALELARAGSDVVVHFRNNREAAEETAGLIRKLDRKAAVLSADLAVAAQLAEFVDRAWTALGNPPDIWINNAGADVLTGGDAKLDFAAKLDTLYDVDVRAALLLSREVGRRFRDAGGGVILNIGWDQADRGMEGDSGELFAVTKNAIMGATRSLAVSLAPKVRVNCIAPGWIRTEWGAGASEYWQERVRRETPLGRWGEPEDVARMARFLCSDDASYITGQVIRVNGGAVR